MADAAAGGTTTTGSTQAAAGTEASAAAGATQTTTQGSAQASTDWTSGLSDDQKGYVQTKGFKDPSAVLESFRGLEKTIGAKAEHVIKLPENMDSPEGRAIWEKLGAPKDAKEYKIEIPKEFGDEALATGLRDVAHKSGMTHKQVENLVTWFNGHNEGLNKVALEEHQAKATQENDSLKKDWGQAYEQNKEIANRAALKLGVDKDLLMGLAEVLGPAKAFKGLYELGVKTGEAAFVGGKSAGGDVMSPAHAQQRIKELKADPTFGKRFASGDADAVRQWHKLNEQAFGQFASAR